MRLVSRDAAAEADTRPGVDPSAHDAGPRARRQRAVKAFVAIVKREFFSYFVSPLAYVVLTSFLLVQRLRLLS